MTTEPIFIEYKLEDNFQNPSFFDIGNNCFFIVCETCDRSNLTSNDLISPFSAIYFKPSGGCTKKIKLFIAQIQVDQKIIIQTNQIDIVGFSARIVKLSSSSFQILYLTTTTTQFNSCHVKIQKGMKMIVTFDSELFNIINDKWDLWASLNKNNLIENVNCLSISESKINNCYFIQNEIRIDFTCPFFSKLTEKFGANIGYLTPPISIKNGVEYLFAAQFIMPHSARAMQFIDSLSSERQLKLSFIILFIFDAIKFEVIKCSDIFTWKKRTFLCPTNIELDSSLNFYISAGHFKDSCLLGKFPKCNNFDVFNFHNISCNSTADEINFIDFE